MCYSAEVSISSSFTMMIAALVLFQRNKTLDRQMAVSMIVFSIMQFSEFLMWKDVKCENGLNEVGSRLGLIDIAFQPLSIMVGSFFVANASKWTRKANKYLIMAYLPFVINAIARGLFSKEKFCSQKKEGFDHLDWPWMQSEYWPGFKEIVPNQHVWYNYQNLAFAIALYAAMLINLKDHPKEGAVIFLANAAIQLDSLKKGYFFPGVWCYNVVYLAGVLLAKSYWL